MIRRVVGFAVRRGFRVFMFGSALAFGGLVANALISESLNGSGKAVTEERAVGQVTEIVHSGIGNVEITSGDTPQLRITADDNILPLIESKNRNGKLVLRTKSGVSIHPVTPITYALSLQQLDNVTVSGTGNIQATGLTSDKLTITLSGAGNAMLNDVKCKTLILNISGVGKTTLTGATEKLVVRLSGAGNVEATGLKAATVETQISGVGHAKVWATDELKAKVSGAGGIQYKGSPRIEQKISGVGSVKSLGG
jgi:hypothetical protein